MLEHSLLVQYTEIGKSVLNLLKDFDARISNLSDKISDANLSKVAATLVTTQKEILDQYREEINALVEDLRGDIRILKDMIAAKDKLDKDIKDMNWKFESLDNSLRPDISSAREKVRDLESCITTTSQELTFHLNQISDRQDQTNQLVETRMRVDEELQKQIDELKAVLLEKNNRRDSSSKNKKGWFSR